MEQIFCAIGETVTLLVSMYVIGVCYIALHVISAEYSWVDRDYFPFSTE